MFIGQTFLATSSGPAPKRLPRRDLAVVMRQPNGGGSGLARRLATAVGADSRVAVESLVIALLVLSVSALGLHPSAVVNRSLPCYELPANIRTTRELRDAIVPLLARSPTLRTQCGKIAGAPKTYVTVELSVGPFSAQTRARSTARRYRSGLLMVDVEIPPASQEFGELLAHELEHVTEFIEGVDFKMLAQSRDSGILRCGASGGFESVRAHQAGRTAAAEVALANEAEESRGQRDRVVRGPSVPVTRWRD
jgi:hypothetical protein